MRRLLVLDGNKLERRYIAAIASATCDVVTEIPTLKSAAKMLANERKRPTLIVSSLEAERQDALGLLRVLRDANLSVPVVLVVGAKAGHLEPEARALGAKFFVQHPIEVSELELAMRVASRNGAASSDVVPPVTDVESQSNLSRLASQLDGTIRCHAGRRRESLGAFITGVFITGANGKNPRRICLRCPIRAAMGMAPYVYYEHICEFCGGDPNKCEALRRFQAGDS